MEEGESFISSMLVISSTLPLSHLLQIVESKKVMRRATLADAIEVWNDNLDIGRYRLMELLEGRGLECTGYMAEGFLRTLHKKPSAAAADGAEE